MLYIMHNLLQRRRKKPLGCYIRLISFLVNGVLEFHFMQWSVDRKNYKGQAPLIATEDQWGYCGSPFFYVKQSSSLSDLYQLITLLKLTIL